MPARVIFVSLEWFANILALPETLESHILSHERIVFTQNTIY